MTRDSTPDAPAGDDAPSNDVPERAGTDEPPDDAQAQRDDGESNVLRAALGALRARLSGPSADSDRPPD